MSTIALVGNPNSGKTTLFNALTGSNQHVGNWPGVTVEKKVGLVKYDNKKYEIVDLPGTYSLGAFSENEKNFGKSLIFVALGEGVAIYGLLIAILIINNL